jgi:hypothetical protein
MGKWIGIGLCLCEIEDIILALLCIEDSGSDTDRGNSDLFTRNSSRETRETSDDTRKHSDVGCYMVFDDKNEDNGKSESVIWAFYTVFV